MRDFIWKVRNWLELAYEWTHDFIRRILPAPDDTAETRGLKIIVYLFVGIIGLMILIGSITFSIAIRGQEETLVPNLRGKELVAALIELQEKRLFSEIQVQFSSEVEKNVVIDQKPAPGTLVKAGKRITLRVSKGMVIDRVEDYRNMSLEEVKIHLQTLYASHKPNLIIKEPVQYAYVQGIPAGRILAQNPDPGTPISGLTFLELVVSKGQGETLVEVGNYVGMSFQEAIDDLSRENIPFAFTVRPAVKGRDPGMVTEQNPKPKEKIQYGRIVQLSMTPPANIGKGKVFGLFSYSLPEQPIAVDIRLDVLSESDRVTILSMKHPGGALAVPYIVQEGSVLALTVLEKEAAREKASPISP